MDLINPPSRHWHCRVRLKGAKNDAVVNDFTYRELQTTIIKPWHAGSTFTVSGTIIRSKDEINEIKIVQTEHPMDFYAEQRHSRLVASGILAIGADSRLFPFSEGKDFTHDLLFSGQHHRSPEPNATLIEHMCQRLPKAARILAKRNRKGKAPYVIADEYDVQDFLHATLRAYLKYSVQEDPLRKVAGTKSGRADISIEELGVLIEVKYVHRPEDDKRLFEELSQDLLLYAKWPHLKTLIYLIYNSADLRDAEQFEQLGGEHDLNGKKFRVTVVLA